MPPTGVTALDGADASLVRPAAFVAVTVNVYDTPMVSPGTMVDRVAPSTITVAPPGDAVTVYTVRGLPPVSPGAAHDTVAEATPGVAVTELGASGSGGGVTVRVAGLVKVVVVGWPAGWLVNTARYWVPLSATWATKLRVGEFAPGTSVKVWPPSVEDCHCTVGLGSPDAAVVNVTAAPSSTDWSTGCSVTAGATVVGCHHSSSASPPKFWYHSTSMVVGPPRPLAAAVNRSA